MSPDELERSLTESAATAQWPPTPDLTPAVLARIAAEAPAPAPRRRSRPRRRVVVAAVLAPLVVGAAAVSPVGATVARFLGVAGGERVERVTTDPGERDAAGAPRPRLDLGRPVRPADAERVAGFRVLRPSAGGADEVRVGGALGPRSVSLLLAPDVVLTQTPGSATLGAGKLLGPSTPVERVRVGGAPGLWIGRGSRVVRILGPQRTVVDWRTALPGSGVLLWDRAGVALRLETTRPLAEALRLAGTVR